MTIDLTTLSDKELKELYGQHKDSLQNLDVKQHAYKILINAAYGACANAYFQHYSLANASAITLTGQIVIKWIEKRLNIYLNTLLKTQGVDYILACDTDSAYLNLGPLVKLLGIEHKSKLEIAADIDTICKTKIQPYIAKCYDELFNYFGHYQNHMFMNREVIADKAIWTGKKRYVMNVYDKEGTVYKDPQLKVTGIEIVRSSTPTVCRDKLKEAMEIILRKDNESLITFIEDFREQYYTLEPHEIAFPRGVNDLAKYKSPDAKSVPIHVRGSLVYNALLVKHGMDKDYNPIMDGDKIKFIYLRLPNPTFGNIVAFSDKLHPQFNLHRYIDYDLQFDKTFLDPLKAITNLIDWKTQEESNLESLFS